MIENELIAHTPHFSTGIGKLPFMKRIDVGESKRKKLILDLDETLVHSSFIQMENYDFKVSVHYQGSIYDIFVLKRPGVDAFLEQLMKHFDVFIFTASMAEYSIPIVKELIPDFPESNILSRQYCRYFRGTFVKDLSIFNCRLNDIIIVDNSSCSYCLQPENGIPVKTWTGDKSDSELLRLTLPFLLECKNYDDVRRLITSKYIF